VSNRISREKESVEKMLVIYCSKKHRKSSELCPDCQKYLEYITERLNHCIFDVKKPVCPKCPNHCYSEDMRRTTAQIMGFSGPRMLYKHPLLVIAHLLDALKG
jgi:predicted amidophosphoribosyltransferase